ncbi:MAG TPA: DNA methyltransferase [Miltoncostaeaceae bacterium]|nr:DNA methyltransferase [Miltoncostaeaceae bacterium]
MTQPRLQPTTFGELYPHLGTLASTPTALEPLDVEPLIRPTRGSKNTAAYNTHSYPTKVPAEAIEPFIAHHTRPGDLVLDPFCGSGMTGLAARRLGRDVVLNDLGFGAAHLAWNLCEPCDPADLRDAARQVLLAVRDDYTDLYATPGRTRQPGTIRWTLYSTVAACAACGAHSRLWDDATDYDAGTVARHWPCPDCGEPIDKRTARVVASEPAWMLIEDEQGTFERAPRPVDLKRLGTINRSKTAEWHPSLPLGPDREMFIRSALQLQSVHDVADFWTPRNRRALGRLWREIQAVDDLRLRQALSFAFTNTAWHGTRMRRYNARGGQRPLTGTLYIPQLSIEVNPAYVFANKIGQLARFYAQPLNSSPKLSVLRGSADALALPDRSVDYCFTDPPFGSNIFYADCAIVWESWLGETTPLAQEAVVNRSLKPTAGGKTVDDYAALMASAFSEIQRVLKANAWATVVFQSSDAEVWAALRTAVEQAGFDLANASYLDKTQQSHKGYKGRSGSEDVASFDVVLNVHKPGATRRQPKPPGGFNDAAAVLRAHLAALPEIGSDDESDRQRTLPFLHSLLVQEHFNGTIGLEVGQYALVRRICEQHFRADARGRWYQEEPRAVTKRAKSPGIA